MWIFSFVTQRKRMFTVTVEGNTSVYFGDSNNF